VAEDRLELAGSRQLPIPGVRVGGPVDPNLRITVSIDLKRRVEPPATSSNMPILSREQLAQRYGANPAGIERVRAFAREYGLQVVSESAETRTVTLAGRAANMNAAFGVKLVKAKTDELEFRHFEGPVTLPLSVAPFVTAVLGLSDRPVARPRAALARSASPSV
jgi:kumamolisin